MENKQWKFSSKVFFLFSFSNFLFDFYGFHLKKAKIIQYDFGIGARNWRIGIGIGENLLVNNKDDTVFMSRNNRSDNCPLEI